MLQNRCSVRVHRVITAGVMFALLSLTAAPALAASPGPKTPPLFTPKAVAKVVASSPTPTSAPTDRAAEAPKKQATASKSFFKTRAGLLVIGVMAVGTGYAMYSAKEDRIRGINR
jgi:hypothetical protein